MVNSSQQFIEFAVLVNKVKAVFDHASQLRTEVTPECRDLTFFVLTDRQTELITLPLAHACID